MRSLLMMAVLALGLFTVSADLAHSDEFALESSFVTGYGVSKAAAKADAKDQLDDVVEGVEEELPTGWEVTGIVQTFEYDGVAYTINYQIIVDDGN